MVKNFICGMAFLLLAAGCEVNRVCTCDQGACSCGKRPLRPISPSCRASRVPFKFGIARYSMCRHKLDHALEIMQDIDCHYLGLMEDGSISYEATDAQIAAYKKKCARYGVEVVSAGPEYFSDEKQCKALFEFAARYGMKYVSVVPYKDNPDWKEGMPGGERRLESDEMMDVLEKYVKTYDIRAAVHNHGPTFPLLYPTAEAALKRIGKRDKRIGVCLDVGHERRSGLDPESFVRRYPDRIVEVHLKNIKIDPAKNYPKEGPRGELDIPGILKSLADVGFGGYCLIEFEKDFAVNEMPLAESLGYFRGVVDTMRIDK